MLMRPSEGATENFKEVLQRIRELTKTSGFSDLGRVLEIGPSSVQRSIDAHKIPSTWIDKLCTKYKVSASWLRDGYGEKYSKKGIAYSEESSVVSGDSETLSPEDIEMRDELIRELRDSRDEWKARALKAERKLEQIETNQNSKTG